VTVCCRKRGGESLIEPGAAQSLLNSVRFRNERRIWWCTAFVVMPDHVHGLIRFTGTGDMRSTIQNWKAWTAKSTGVSWQRDWFDHRLRGDQSEREKANYLWQNPVRAGLVDDAEQWPWYFSELR